MGDYTEVYAIAVIKDKYCSKFGQSQLYSEIKGEWEKLYERMYYCINSQNQKR